MSIAEITGSNVRIANIHTNKAYEGFTTRGGHSKPIDELEIEQCYFESTYKTAIRLGRNGEHVKKAEIQNVQAYKDEEYNEKKLPSWDSEIYQFGRNDHLVLENVAVAFGLGFSFFYYPNLGGSNAKLNNCSADFCQRSFEISGKHHVEINGGYYWARYQAMRILPHSIDKATITVNTAVLNGNKGVVFIQRENTRGDNTIALNQCLLRTDASPGPDDECFVVNNDGPTEVQINNSILNSYFTDNFKKGSVNLYDHCRKTKSHSYDMGTSVTDDPRRPSSKNT